jgi:ribosomal protein RSM22 (predicted rRNA methylase)
MNNELYNCVKEELCPGGIWELSEAAKSILYNFLNKLPRNSVSEEETRYPTTPSGMRASLDTFFARHYFQVQNSLLEYMTSEEFLYSLNRDTFNILDIGSGPGTASLAITDMLASVLKYLPMVFPQTKIKEFRINYILNDPSEINLCISQQILNKYFKLRGKSGLGFHQGVTFRLDKKFPENMSQLKRIQRNLGPFNIINVVYILNLLFDQLEAKDIKKCLLEVEELCCPVGRILLVQDKFSKSVIRRTSSLIGQSCRRKILSQFVYSSRNENNVYSYKYYNCLFSPREGILKFVAA